MKRAFALLLALGTVIACRPSTSTDTPSTCGAESCDGCCRADGRCMPGNAAELCGKLGAACASCGSGATCNSGACVPAGGNVSDGGGSDGGSNGGSCAQPIDIPLVNGVGVATGDTSGQADNAVGSCGGAGGADLVYRIVTPTAGTLTIDVRPTTSGLQPAVYVRSACDVAISQPPADCAAAATGGGAISLGLQNLPAGAYFLWVDGAPGSQGPFGINVTLSSNAGSTCTAPLPLAFGAGEANASGSLAGMGNHSGGSCGGSSGTDVVYSFTTTATYDLSATLSAASASAQPAIYLRSSCSTGELGCGVAASTGKSASLRSGSLPPGSYFLWVDNANATAGDYQLYVHLTAPALGDTCANPKPLTFSSGQAGGSVTDTGDTSPLFGNTSSSCGGIGGPDLVYSFTTNTILDLRASASTTSGAFQPVLYLRSGSCTVAERACGAAATTGGTASLAAGSLAPGTYYLWVDGLNGSAGPYNLSATLTPPAQGDTCANPKPLTFSSGQAGGSATDTGDTSALFDNTSSGCGGIGGPDMVYTFTTNTVLDLRANASTTSGTFKPVLYLRSGACTGPEKTCAAATVGGTAPLGAGSLPAGTYYLWVDGLNGSAGPYSLNATLTPPAPGDTCANPIALNLSTGSATVAGDTTAFFNDAVGICGGTTGPDLVYSFTTTATKTITATLSTTSSAYFPVMYLRRTTCAGTELTCGAATVAGQTVTLSSATQPADTYFVWVDGLNGSAGPYSLTVSLTP